LKTFPSNNKPNMRKTIALGVFLCVCLGANLGAKAQNVQTDQTSAARAQQEASPTSSPSGVVELTPQPAKAAEISSVEPESSAQEVSAQETNTAVPAPTTLLQSGLASYYGKWFHGRKTANGEIFNMTTLTAAHPTLPFGTLLKVTNTHNDQSVVVRVNDRGPYKGQRIIDLSQYAAAKIGMLSRGLATVVIEIFKP
jgi:rare lipoprotein A